MRPQTDPCPHVIGLELVLGQSFIANWMVVEVLHGWRAFHETRLQMSYKHIPSTLVLETKLSAPMFAARLHSFRKLTLSCQLWSKEDCMIMIRVCPITKSLALTLWNPKSICMLGEINCSLHLSKHVQSKEKIQQAWRTMRSESHRNLEQIKESGSTNDQDQINMVQSEHVQSLFLC